MHLEECLRDWKHMHAMFYELPPVACCDLLRVCGRPVAFRPAHQQKLANEFMLYTDCEALAEDLGGWDKAAGTEPASVKEHR